MYVMGGRDVVEKRRALLACPDREVWTYMV